MSQLQAPASRAFSFFATDPIDGYLALKWQEGYLFEHTPHPVEYQLRHSC